jgi:transposase
LAGDKGYSYRWIRRWLGRHRIEGIIPEREDPRLKRPGPWPDFDRKTYRRRNIIERCVGWLKECRRIATRFEKLAVNFVAMLKLAIIERYLRRDLSDRA